MRKELIERIKLFLSDVDYSINIATDIEIQKAEEELGVSLDESHKNFIKTFGGCYVGIAIYSFKNSVELENISFVELTERYKSQKFSMEADSYVISFDGSGNPILIERDGTVFVYDHNIEEKRRLSNSFERLIEDVLPD